MNHNEKLLFLIKYLISENPFYADKKISGDKEEMFNLFRSLVNVREAKPIGGDFLTVQDEFLKEEAEAKGITDIADLKPIRENIYLWKGDITTLKCGAIVNAANSGLTGCWQPCHICIDNTIHTYAGVQLRLKCAEIIRNQGHSEPTGQAKVTPAYNLPCEYVIHTVGPIVSGRLNDEHCRLLESCYDSCLNAAIKNGADSIAFCCISTGVFGFPQQEAAEIAVKTVTERLKTDKIKVIFNVFSQKDHDIYYNILNL